MSEKQGTQEKRTKTPTEVANNHLDGTDTGFPWGAVLAPLATGAIVAETILNNPSLSMEGKAGYILATAAITAGAIGVGIWIS